MLFYLFFMLFYFVLVAYMKQCAFFVCTKTLGETDIYI